MIKYLFSCKNPHKHFINIDLKVKTKGEQSISFQLPAWRPGRYELADFAKNIQKWNAFDENGNEIPFRKITKDLWEVSCGGVEEVTISYNYYANVLDACSWRFMCQIWSIKQASSICLSNLLLKLYSRA